MSTGLMLSDSSMNIPEIKKWLGQINPEDQWLAQNFLKCLEFIPFDDFRSYIHDEITGITSDGPLALFACRKFEEGCSFFFDVYGEVISSTVRGNGSEDIISAEIRNIVRSSDSRFLNTPSINIMREKKVKTIVIIDDSIGSGKRLMDFFNIFFSHSSLKSWFSLASSKVYVISYAYDTNSTFKWHEARIGKKSFIDAPKRLKKIIFKYAIILGNGFAKADPTFLSEIRNFCSKYACGRKHALGYNDSMGHVIFSHSCPNNVPCIVWNAAKNWEPLFRWRCINPDFMMRLQKTATPWISGCVDISLPHHFGQSNAKKIVELLYCRKTYLGAFSKYDNVVLQMALHTGYSIEIVKDCLRKAQELEYLDEDLWLTDSGLDFLKYSIRKNKVLEISKPYSKLYIPK